MSILIRGMEMPKSCLVCSCTDTEYGECVLDPEKRCPEDYGKRADWCPIVPVPPHGRLIDAETLIDAIIAKYIRHERHRELVFAVVQIKQDMVDIINELPTIIPADKEGEV